MGSNYFLYLLFVIGAVPVLIAGYFGNQRAVFYTGLGSLLLLVAAIVFAPPAPHPFLEILALMMMPSVIFGWLLARHISNRRIRKAEA